MATDHTALAASRQFVRAQRRLRAVLFEARTQLRNEHETATNVAAALAPGRHCFRLDRLWGLVADWALGERCKGWQSVCSTPSRAACLGVQHGQAYEHRPNVRLCIATEAMSKAATNPKTARRTQRLTKGEIVSPHLPDGRFLCLERLFTCRAFAVSRALRHECQDSINDKQHDSLASEKSLRPSEPSVDSDVRPERSTLLSVHASGMLHRPDLRAARCRSTKHLLAAESEVCAAAN